MTAIHSHIKEKQITTRGEFMDKLFGDIKTTDNTLENISLEYERTEITTVFLHDKEDNLFINIFSVAEMCPHEQEKSKEIYDFKKDREKVSLKRLNLNKDKIVYISRYFSDDPKDALNFYRGSGNKRIFKIDCEEISIESACDNLTAEPLNEIPVLIPSSTEENFAIRDILPKRKTSTRVCSLLDLKMKCFSMFTENELTKIDGFAYELLGVSLLKYSEYFGSIILCFANPVLRYIKERMSESKNQIVIQLFERKNKTIIGGKIEISDERISGKGFIIVKDIEKASFIVNIPCPPDKLKVRIFNNYGTLIEETSGHFMGEFHMSIGFLAGKRKFELENDEGKSEEFEIDIVNYESRRYKEKNTAQNTMIKSNKNRELDSLEERREFIYFPGNDLESKKKARMIVRELIGKSRERCIICDPYLSGKDVSQYALFINHSNVEIKLLGSAKYLSETMGGEAKSNGDKLKKTIDNIVSQDKTLKINCHVLLGNKKSPLHDRFIIVDDDVYLLGSSLSEFGSRATTLFKTPDPRPLIRQADIWFKESESSKHIDEWLKKSTIDQEEKEEC